MRAPDIARLLGQRAERLVADLLPGGRREGQEWRCGSVAGEPGGSLGVHLTGTKGGVWSDFSSGEKGDALDLVCAVFGLDMHDALAWSHRWLGIEEGEAVVVPRRPAPSKPVEQPHDPMRWLRPWQAARPIAGTLAEAYLAGRRLHFDDPEGRVLRFASRRARKSPEDQLEHHPAMLAALCDVRTGQQVGILNVYLRSDGIDRLRGAKAKTNTGSAKGAAVMLSTFDEPIGGLTIGEGIETCIALLMTGLAPVWACGGAGFLASFPVLDGIEALTVAADADGPGRAAAAAVAGRWREVGSEVVIIMPPAGDWADPKPGAST